MQTLPFQRQEDFQDLESLSRKKSCTVTRAVELTLENQSSRLHAATYILHDPEVVADTS